MIVIEAPTKYVAQRGDILIFLGGGISNCPDWQKDILEILESRVTNDQVVILNPRRSDFDVSNIEDSALQIQWEYDQLDKADLVLFWFPCETVCPITLFELGKMVGRGQQIVVGCHPFYSRMFDVKYQLAIELPDLKVVDNIQDLASHALEYLYGCNKKFIKFV
jgi:hypothetical protein